MNSPKDIARTRAWVKSNPERSRAIKKAYKLRHREKLLSKERAGAKRRRASLTEQRRQENREYAKQRYHNVLAKDVNKRLLINLRTRLYKAVKGIAKCDRTVHLLGCSIESFKLYLESLFQERMNWDNYGQWHIDHIMPCAIFDLSNPEHQKRCFHFSNMQPLWCQDNLSKNAFVPPVHQFKLL